ncbi:Fpg/Nei family DNA glycosylase [Fibrella forsythiae]|uniref:DNA-formamidopyrimidine glycosylase n=1 Tax=Fibrella forsythiae TaxID=2817061 RepID=A0ABS3JJM9_9BACT|nr:DNA-formamidopyrimidine glycosylase family protein [Fibrella forsythiae]MBO0950195.1 DNA-formamidopyrimidine glycosylase [Fibrella forsythiae]
MPELPEVEMRRLYLEATSFDQPIDSITVEDQKLLTTDFNTLQESLYNRRFLSTKRVGKNLFIYTDNPSVIVRMHFGMTGDLVYYHNSIDRPRHARIVFYFKNGFCLGFVCPRKFERIGLVSDIDAYLKQKKIAPDALSIDVGTLSDKLKKRRSPVKPVLLDQATTAGLGNWIVDEVLFQAMIHPSSISADLSDTQVKAIHDAIHFVLETAIAREANYRDFPPSFLIHARQWDASPYDDPEAYKFCPRCGTKIEVIEVGGRTTYFCPKEQVIS